MNKIATEQVILLDGSRGEGGGQILRTSLSLSAITGKPFRIESIRAGRAKPGLLRQHLTCVNAAAAVCGAKVDGAELGSGLLTFEPGQIEAHNGEFSIGTAGSTSLLAQTLIPILLHGPAASRINLVGGTHVIKAPCFEYLDEVFLPQIRRMGARVSARLDRHGFFPAGGGKLTLEIEPSELRPAEWHEKNERKISVEVISTDGVCNSVAERELALVRRSLSLAGDQCNVRVVQDVICQGNALLIRSQGESDDPGTLISSIGKRGKRARQVAEDALRELRSFEGSAGPVDEHLADQLLLPLALAGGGGFTAVALTPHFHSNVEVIEKFLPVRITSTQGENREWIVKIES